ncbi:hypothetical protein MBLNU459_g5597t1 [Dothideomycetes sp. NU459]
MASFTNGTNGHGESKGIQPKITLYTNHGCPYAHRAHIALAELGLEFDEVIIDLDTPREPWYLEINPRGLVPTIKYSNGLLKDEIITESAIVAQFLADSRPSHLLPSTLHDPHAPLFRARVAFFVDTWNTKVQANLFPILKASASEQESIAAAMISTIEKEIEPLLADAKPFFGGREKLTFAEVIIAPFLLRFFAMSNGELLPKSLREGIEKLPNTGRWAKEVVKQESVLRIWDEENVVTKMGERIAKMRAA